MLNFNNQVKSLSWKFFVNILMLPASSTTINQWSTSEIIVPATCWLLPFVLIFTLFTFWDSFFYLKGSFQTLRSQKSNLYFVIWHNFIALSVFVEVRLKKGLWSGIVFHFISLPFQQFAWNFRCLVSLKDL